MGDDKGWGIIVGFVGVVCLLVGLGLGCALGSQHQRDAAFKAGAGHYESDPKTGAARFVYECSVPAHQHRTGANTP